MGFLLDTFGPIIQILMYVMYGVYVLLGLVLVVIGIMSLTRKLLTSFCIGIIIVGVFMMLVGALAVYCTMSQNWLIMLVVLLIDLALFLVLFSTALTALFIGVGGGDPVTYVMDELYPAARNADGPAMDNGFCYNAIDTGTDVTGVSWTECKAYYNAGEPISTACWEDVYAFGGNCTNLMMQTTIREYNDVGSNNKLATDKYWSVSGVNTLTDDYIKETDSTGNDDYIAAFQPSDPSSTCAAADHTATIEGCHTCWHECKDNLTLIAKDNMYPAALASLCIFFYFVITAALNSFGLGLTDEDEDGEEEFAITGIWLILMCVLNGLVMLLGLALLIMGIIAYASDCPLGGGMECPQSGILGVIIVGAGVFVTGALIIAGIFLKLKLLIVVGNLVFTILCLVLLIVTTALGLAAGVLGEASTQYDENWAEARDNIRKIGRDETDDFCQEESYTATTGTVTCTTADYAVAGCNKGKEECIDEIQALVEDYADRFAIVGIIISVFMIVIIWFTYLSIRIFRGGDDDDDDDDDE
jgi:hypothetical protein